MYMEDFELIRRLHRLGITAFYPYVTIMHNHDKGSYKKFNMLFSHIKSAYIYFEEYGWIFDKERNQMNRKIKEEENIM